MLRSRWLGNACILLAVSTCCACARDYAQTAPLPQDRQQLSVVLYPFVPAFAYAAETVKKGFEAENPGIRLNIVDLSDNYYAPGDSAHPDPTYIGSATADVYELDSVFLADFVREKKIQPLSDDVLLSRAQLLANAYEGSELGGVRYGSAHWVCGDFLFYTKQRSPSHALETLRDLEHFVGADPRGLMVDLRGRLTLGEFYLGAAYARYGDWAHVKDHLAVPDEGLISDLVRLLRLCTAGYCRDQIFHELTGIYGQEFAQQRAGSLIGYSELLHSVLKESELCGTACVADADLGVSPLPLDDAGVHPISWVDSFTVSTKCTDSCYQRAAAFIRFMQREDTYVKLLLPDRMSFLENPAGPAPVAAYLLPARGSLYANKDLLSAAHLYPELKAIIERASVPVSEGLNQNLRVVSKAVEAALSKAPPG